MGKSNKFDYTNRPNSGAKLGHIIGQALQKEADKLYKDAEKQVAKPRKASPGSEATLSSRDIAFHMLDIKAPGKQLSDEGTCALAVGLESALRKSNTMVLLALEDLNLSDNSITTSSLARLAPIIELARHDLKTINLSNNLIKVQTREEAGQWEQFLKSFKGCIKLRRLDLSGNAMLGAKALEIFFRVHLAENPISPISTGGEVHVYPLDGSYADIDGHDDDDQATPTQITTFRDNETHLDRLSHVQVLNQCCGLRSIPYLALQDIGLTDAGALWLSYLIGDHHYPNQLIEELAATPLGTNAKAYQQNNNLRGVDWDEQEAGMGKDGLYLLKQTEAIKLHAMFEERSVLSEFESLTELTASEEPGELMQRKPTDRHKATVVTGPRNVSFRSIRSNDALEHETGELESTRRKIQRNVIAQHGAASVDLWRAALKAVVVYRILMFCRPAYRRLYYGPPRFNFQQSHTKKASAHHASSLVNPNRRGHSTNTSPTRQSVVSKRGNYASTLIAQDPNITPGEPELVITDVTNTPRTPKLLFRPHRKGGFSEGSDDLHRVSAKLEGLALAAARDHDDPQRFARWQEEYRQRRRQSDPSDSTIDGHSSPFRDLRVPSHLPAAVVSRIGDFVLSTEERAAMTEQQRARIATWVRNRSNFEAQREWRKMADSAQVWTLLESIGCLNYER